MAKQNLNDRFVHTICKHHRKNEQCLTWSSSLAKRKTDDMSPICCCTSMDKFPLSDWIPRHDIQFQASGDSAQKIHWPKIIDTNEQTHIRMDRRTHGNSIYPYTLRVARDTNWHTCVNWMDYSTSYLCSMINHNKWQEANQKCWRAICNYDERGSERCNC